MRLVGIVFIGVGIALFLFVLITSLKNEGKMISPVPEQQGVRVIYITSPSP